LSWNRAWTKKDGERTQKASFFFCIFQEKTDNSIKHFESHTVKGPKTQYKLVSFDSISSFLSIFDSDNLGFLNHLFTDQN